MESLNVGIARMEENIHSLKEDINEIKDSLKALNKSINGNGNPGILARLNSLEGGLKVLTFLILVGVSVFCAFA